MFALSEDQIKKAESELQNKAETVVKQLKETPIEDVKDQITKSETETEITKKVGKKQK